jgi:Flp pilus assembly protein TadG
MMRSPAFLRRFRRDQNGLSAVEFALLAPVMILLYFGMVELCQAYMAHKRMSHVASMVADMTARAETVNQNSLGETFNIGGQIMQPFSAAPLAMRVSSVTRGDDGVVRVNWSYGRGLSPISGERTVPDGLIDNKQSLIVSEAVYDYDSPINRFLPGITKMSRTFYLRPRSVETVTCSNC